MFDLVIAGGRVVTPDGVAFLDVGVVGERIAAIGAPGSLGDAGRTIDARGKIVVPGGIDPHVHSRWALPNPDGGEPKWSASPDQVSRAALFGGTTTWIDFVMCPAGKDVQQAIEERLVDWQGKCYSDYGFHLMLLGAVSENTLGQLPDAIADGFTSVKIFTTDVTPSRKGRMVPYGSIHEVLQILARHRGVAAIHAEDNDLVMHMYERMIREGKTHFTHLPEVHSSLSEELSFNRVIRLAENVEGAALYMMHVSASTGVSAIEEARAMGYPIYGETLHHYSLFDQDAYGWENGQIYHTYPSLKSREDCRDLWRGMLNGTIGSVATDGICTSLEVKLEGSRIDDVTGGNAGVEPRMGVMFTEAVVNRGMSLEAFVALTSSNAAKIFGMYPQKGAIAIGSDADIVLIEPRAGQPLQVQDLHETDYSPWEGWEIRGWPVVTISRGAVVVEGGKFLPKEATGRLVKRKVADAVFSGPIS